MLSKIICICNKCSEGKSNSFCLCFDGANECFNNRLLKLSLILQFHFLIYKEKIRFSRT